jgi:hypothetical protein
LMKRQTEGIALSTKVWLKEQECTGSLGSYYTVMMCRFFSEVQGGNQMNELIRRVAAPEKSLAFEPVRCSYVGTRLLAQFHGDWSQNEMSILERVLLARADTTHWVLCKFGPLNLEQYEARLATWEFWHYRRKAAQLLAHAIQTNSRWIDTPRYSDQM